MSDDPLDAQLAGRLNGMCNLNEPIEQYSLRIKYEELARECWKLRCTIRSMEPYFDTRGYQIDCARPQSGDVAMEPYDSIWKLIVAAVKGEEVL